MKVSNKRARLLTGLRRFSRNRRAKQTHLKSVPFYFIDKRGPWFLDIEFDGFAEFGAGVVAFAERIYSSLIKVTFQSANPNTESERLNFSQFLNIQPPKENDARIDS